MAVVAMATTRGADIVGVAVFGGIERGSERVGIGLPIGMPNTALMPMASTITLAVTWNGDVHVDVMPEVGGITAGFVPAIGRGHSPRGLQRHKSQQEDSDEATHEAADSMDRPARPDGTGHDTRR